MFILLTVSTNTRITPFLVMYIRARAYKVYQALRGLESRLYSIPAYIMVNMKVAIGLAACMGESLKNVSGEYIRASK